MEHVYGVKANVNSIIMAINASSSVKLHIGFTPDHNLPVTSLIIVRCVAHSSLVILFSVEFDDVCLKSSYLR